MSVLLLIAGCKVQKSAHVQEPVQRDGRFMYYYYEAQRCLSQQEFDRAMCLLVFCEQLCPDDAATHQALGYMYQATSQKELALSHYEKAFAGEPTAYWSHYASMLFELDQKDKAAEVLNRASALAPKDIDIMEALSAVYTDQKKYKKALLVQDKIETVEGITAYNALARYRLYLQLGNADKAVQAIDNYLLENPDDLRFRVFRADLFLSQGKENEALELYRQELEKHPDNPFVFLSLSNYYGSKDMPETAAEYLQKALFSDEWDLQQKLQALRDGGMQRLDGASMVETTLLRLTRDYPIEEASHNALAQYYISQARYRDALLVLYTMIDINGSNSSTWQTALQVMQADSTTGNDEYEHLIRGAYSRMPDDPLWAYWMTRVLLMNQQTDSALTVAREGAAKQGDVRYRLGLRILEGDICTLQGDMPATYAAYEQALAIDPNNVYVLNNYAYMLATHDGDLRRAEQMSRKTIEAEPDNATYLDTYAWILHLQNQDFLAQYYIQKAIDNMKTDEAEEIKQHYTVITGKTIDK